MTQVGSDAKCCLPAITRVELSAFELYRLRPDVRIKVEKPVFCLIGANGLGKSTFLTTLLYGLTGGIPYRARGFSSPREYVREATRQDRRRDYFGGRVSEAAEEHAAVRVRLRWPDAAVWVTRELFGTGAVTAVEIEANGASEETVVSGESADSTYRQLVADQCGLASFDQFVFLMHYVCVFDEDRHLLLWDPTALTNALYLAFGTDGEQAARANELKREVERLASRARNSRFAARRSLDEVSKLRDVLSGQRGDPPDQGTRERYDRLNGRLEEAAERVHRKDVEMRKAEALVADRSAALTGLQFEYDEAFAVRAAASAIIRHHPLVRATLRGDRCVVCGTNGVATHLQSLMEEGSCPLCGSGVAAGADAGANVEKLKALDRRIEAAQAELGTAHDRRGRLREDYDAAVQEESAAREAREEFLMENPEAERYRAPEHTPLEAAMERARAEAERFDLQSKREYRERDRARNRLRGIERELQISFDLHSELFVERFRSYATAFVGLAVDIELEHRRRTTETGFELMLSMEDQPRSRADAVSESQRFFLDIALRMALAESMSPGGATLFIDTPEGSLDITYEARAGQMFSEFVEQGNAIVMTANLKSSALLLRLAERQSREGMQVERMTEWTDLSEVQRAEEELFTRAFAEIERSLG